MTARDRYGRRAAAVYARAIDPLIRPLRPRIAALCKAHGADRVLDIACATGVQCRVLAAHGLQPTGMDLSESMIAAARRADPEGDYCVGSAYDLPFRDESFDAAVLSLALHEHTESERSIMLREAARVTRIGGTLVVADFVRPPRAAVHPPWWVIRVVESVAGAEHRAGFVDFVNQGGLKGLIERHDLVPLNQTRSHFGALGVIVARRPRELPRL